MEGRGYFEGMSKIELCVLRKVSVVSLIFGPAGGPCQPNGRNL